MSLQSVIEAAQFRITGGSPFMWKCYGLNARALEFTAAGQEYYSALVYFDSESQVVYEINFHPNANDPASYSAQNYRWINPQFLEAHNTESTERGVDPKIYIDEERWIDCDLEEDIVDKISTFFRTGTYDERILVPLDLSDESIKALKDLAEKEGKTIDEIVNNILEDIIKSHQNK